MVRPVIISCAVTGGGPTVGKHPAIPVTPEEIATAAIEAGKAGATIAHIHVRNPETGMGWGDHDCYREVVRRIRDSGSEILINLTTGHGGMIVAKGSAKDNWAKPTEDLLQPEDRVTHIEELQPEICSLDMGTMNFGDNIFMNTRYDIAGIAKGISRTRTIAELEVFDTGHTRMALAMLDRGELPKRHIFQLCLGVPWGAPATAEAMILMRDMLPPKALWTAFGIGTSEFPMVAQAVLLGGHVRVGLEDNLYIDRGVFAPDNAALVRRAAEIITLLGEEVATPAQTRHLLAQAIGDEAVVP